MDKFIGGYKDISVWHLDPQQIFDFSRRVFAIYSQVYTEKYNWKSDLLDLKSIYGEDLEYCRHSTFLGIKYKNEILSTIRLTLKNLNITLPLESEFNINIYSTLLEHNLKPHEIWHCGRTTINKEIIAKMNQPTNFSASILKSLLYYAMNHTNSDSSNVLFAETDKVTHRIYASMGLKWIKLSKERSDYMGSPTFATMLPMQRALNVDWLTKFDLETEMRSFFSP